MNNTIKKSAQYEVTISIAGKNWYMQECYMPNVKKVVVNDYTAYLSEVTPDMYNTGDFSSVTGLYLDVTKKESVLIDDKEYVHIDFYGTDIIGDFADEFVQEIESGIYY